MLKKDTIIKNVELFNETVLKQLGESVKGLKFGNIVITVHNGRITQIDKTEKIRFEQSPLYEKGSGI